MHNPQCLYFLEQKYLTRNTLHHSTWDEEANEIKKNLAEKTTENQSKSCLIQRISIIALQRANAASIALILGTILETTDKLDTV